MSVNYGNPNYRPLVDFGWFSEGWNLFKQQPTTWIVAVLIAVVIDSVVTGTLNGATGMTANSPFRHPGGANVNFGNYLRLDSPLHDLASFIEAMVFGILSAGLYRMAIRQIRGEKIGPGDIFAIGDVFVPLLGVIALTWLCTVAGFVLCVVPGLIINGLFMFAPLFVVARRMGPIEAISCSVNALKNQWAMATLFYAVASLFVILSFLACCVGEFAVFPQFILAITIGFARFTGETGSSSQIYTGPQPAGTWPPAPGTYQPPYGQSPYNQPMSGQHAAPGEEPPIQSGPGQPPQGWHGRVDDTYVDIPTPKFDEHPANRPPTDQSQR